MRRRRQRLGRLAPARADPHGRRGVDRHRPRLDQRHQAQRPRRPVGAAVRRRPHHGRSHTDRVPERLMLAATPPFALSALKYGLLALLFLFVWRSMRWVVRGLNVDRTPSGAAIGGAPAADPPPRPSMLMVSPDGQKPWSARLDGSTTIGRSVECELRLLGKLPSAPQPRVFNPTRNRYI